MVQLTGITRFKTVTCVLWIVWQVKSLKSTLESLPTEMRAKAMEFISKSMGPATSSDVYVYIHAMDIMYFLLVA